MTSLIPVRHLDDVLPAYRDTPVATLLAYHNLKAPHRPHDTAELLIGVCMDNRIVLRIPENFAYVLRAGGANLRRIEFKVSFAVAVGGIRTICLIAHSQCGMVNLPSRREAFVTGLMENGGWAREDAEKHFDQFSTVFAIEDPGEFVCSEARRLRERYPRVKVAPLFYRVEESLLYQIAEG